MWLTLVATFVVIPASIWRPRHTGNCELPLRVMENFYKVLGKGRGREKTRHRRTSSSSHFIFFFRCGCFCCRPGEGLLRWIWRRRLLLLVFIWWLSPLFPPSSPPATAAAVPWLPRRPVGPAAGLRGGGQPPACPRPHRLQHPVAAHRTLLDGGQEGAAHGRSDGRSCLHLQFLDLEARSLVVLIRDSGPDYGWRGRAGRRAL